MKRSHFSSKDWAIPLGVGLLVTLLGQSVGWGQNSILNSDHSGATWSRRPITKLTDGNEPPDTLPTPGMLPHAGDYVSNEKNYYEIVYMPLQTRIYIYSNRFKPISAQDVQAQMTLRLPTEAMARKIPFQFVPQPAGSNEQDFVAANFDIRPLQDKEVGISFELSNKSDPSVMTPYYAHFNIRPFVARAAVTVADQEAIARQQTCPVTGVPLVGRKQVVKVYVAEFPLYLSGEDCIVAVKQAPQRFVPQAPQSPSMGR
jgi:hypothetical protein